jgi:hypothetical protein
VPLTSGQTLDLDLEAYSESLYPRDGFGWSDLRAVREGRFKYIDAPRPELYDLRSDPEERRNVYASRTPLAGAMKLRVNEVARLDGALERAAARGGEDPARAAALAALGYVSPSSPAPSTRHRLLADPKDQIADANRSSARGASRPCARGACRSPDDTVAAARDCPGGLQRHLTIVRAVQSDQSDAHVVCRWADDPERSP